MRSLPRWLVLWCLGWLLVLGFSPAHAQIEPTRQLAQTLNAQGQQAFAQGQPEAALALWQQATEVYRTLGDEVGITGSSINQSQALETLGHYRRACQTLLKAINVNEQHCDARNGLELESVERAIQQQSDENLQMLSLRSLGNALRLTGQLSQAQQLLSQSVALAQKYENSQQQLLSLLGLAKVGQDLYQQIAYRYDQSGSAEEAAELQTLANQVLTQYTEAEHLAQSIPGDNALLLTQATVRQLALLATIQSQPAAAKLFPTLAHQLQAQLLAVKNLPDLPPSRAALYAHIDLAKSYITLFPSASAPPLADISHLLAQAQRSAADLNDSEAQSYALGTLGHLYEQVAQQNNRPDHWQPAQQVTETALQLAQTIQAAHIVYQWQWQLGRILTAQQNVEGAIATYQAAAQTLQTLRQDLIAIDSEAQFSFRDKVEPLYREFVALLVKTSADTSPSQQNLSQAIREIDALRLTELENFLSCNLTQTFELAEPQADKTTAIIYPILLPNEVVVIARFPQTTDLIFHHIAISEAEISQVLNELRQQAENLYLSDSLFERAQQVYDWLIRPIAPLLEQQNVQTLVFVSDGALRNVPMSILHNGQHFLLEDYAIALSPGLQLPQSQSLSQIKLAAIAFGLSEIRPGFQPHEGFGPLPNVRTELASINNQFPGRQYLNQDFTAQSLQSLGDQGSAPIVHLATHGQFSSNPNNTYLLAWDRRITLNDFGQILQSQTTPQRTNIELLILSACKTANGDSRATLGLAGIAIQSGASSTIASLWSVDDQSTTELMTRLYQKLHLSSTALSRAEMLRQAQLELLQTPGYEAPFFWAPYVLVGNWS